MSFVKQSVIKAAMVVAMMSALALPAAAQQVKIGVVNLPLLMDRAPQTKAMLTALQEEFAPRQREFEAKLITTAPSVIYEVETVSGEILAIDNPSKLPEPTKIQCIREPFVRLEVHVPNEFVGAVLALCDPDDYGEVLEALRSPAGVLTVASWLVWLLISKLCQ